MHSATKSFEINNNNNQKLSLNDNNIIVSTITSNIFYDLNNQTYMSPTLCKEGILFRFEELVNQLAVGWKYHVANTDGIKDAWISFENYYNNVCSFTQGLKKNINFIK